MREPSDRCYHCKEKYTQSSLKLPGEELDYVVDGAMLTMSVITVQDCGQVWKWEKRLCWRPLTKEEIRAVSRELGLPTADKPANPCLASRFPYGTAITGEGLKQVGEAEEALREMGFAGVRVRHHANLARIEVSPGSMPAVLEKSRSIVLKFREIGYTYVTLDLQGYRTGSMNEMLEI